MPEPRWLIRAREYLGVRETPGAANNPTILGWAKKIGGWVAGWYKSDGTAWCGLYVGAVMSEFGFTLPKNPLGALQWAEFGKPCKPVVGAVMVFTRKGGGHVGFYVSEDETTFHILGGNQSDAVTIARIAKDRFVAARWPFGEPVTTGPVVRQFKAALSTNEA
jgi:uncharacterized protein (TIGR02594 family)